jgi:hypothetical protein
MKKRSLFAADLRDDWPAPQEIERYFLGPPEQRWFSRTDAEGAGFFADGVDGTDQLKPNAGRTNISLHLRVHPKWGALLQWSKRRKGLDETYYSKGDLSRLREYCYVGQSGPLPVGLFIPLEVAWVAVKEFLESDGALPTRIQWAAVRDLPPDTFPDPWLASQRTEL